MTKSSKSTNETDKLEEHKDVKIDLLAPGNQHSQTVMSRKVYLANVMTQFYHRQQTKSKTVQKPFSAAEKHFCAS